MMRNKEIESRRILRTECAELHVREVDGDDTPSRTITGYAILFGVPSATLWSDEESEAREVIAPEAVTRELLDSCDIKFTMFHDRQLILARSNGGNGTLSYAVDDKGVRFEFEAPNTSDGDKALELVRRGDISGCSFAFTTRYWDSDFVERTCETVDGKTIVTYTVRTITGVYDFTLAADPAYPDTSVEAREFITLLREAGNPGDSVITVDRETMRKQLREMRRAASQKLY
ncbi:MAG: HK97 family phage prohead protease [Pseudoflavonifractor sp.]|nr:HK97 family phage prohead protease [Pseudoflavonifractor sp.]